MSTYVLLTRVTPEAIKDPKTFEELNERVTQKLEEDVPHVKWLANYAVLGPYDYLDIFEAPGNDTATKVALIIRSFGHATTETWPAEPWDRFKEIVRETAS